MRIGKALALEWDDNYVHARFVEARRSIYRGRLPYPHPEVLSDGENSHRKFHKSLITGVN